VCQQHLACPVKPKILAKFGRLFSPKNKNIHLYLKIQKAPKSKKETKTS